MVQTILPFSFSPHTADLQLEVTGTSLEELFRNALAGMLSIFEAEIDTTQPPTPYPIILTATSLEQLLVKFLSEALFLNTVHHVTFPQITINSITPTSLEATLEGQKITRRKPLEIKAVTYHNLEIKQHNGLWHATIVFDI